MSGHNVMKEMRGLEALKNALRDDIDLSDPETVLALIEGETDLVEACEVVLDDIDEKEALAVGLKAKCDQYKTRHAVLLERAAKLKVLLLMVLTKIPVEDNEQPRLELPNGLLSRVPTQRKVEIDDESQIPSRHMKRPDPQPNKQTLLAELKKLKKEEDELRRAASLINDDPGRKELLKKADAKFIPGCHLSEPGYTLRITR